MYSKQWKLALKGEINIMKIGVISDTHGIVSAWDKAMALFDGVDIILHAGDVLYHPPRVGCTAKYDIPELVERMNASSVPIVIARGNCDSEVYEELLKFPVLSPYAFVDLDGLRIIVEHGHNLSKDKMSALAEKYHADVFVTGHTHIPVIERIGSAVHLNPGSPSHPKLEIDGVSVPTVAIITDGKVKVVRLDNGEEIMGMPLSSHQKQS